MKKESGMFNVESLFYLMFAGGIVLGVFSMFLWVATKNIYFLAAGLFLSFGGFLLLHFAPK